MHEVSYSRFGKANRIAHPRPADQRTVRVLRDLTDKFRVSIWIRNMPPPCRIP